MLLLWTRVFVSSFQMNMCNVAGFGTQGWGVNSFPYLGNQSSKKLSLTSKQHHSKKKSHQNHNIFSEMKCQMQTQKKVWFHTNLKKKLKNLPMFKKIIKLHTLKNQSLKSEKFLIRLWRHKSSGDDDHWRCNWASAQDLFT